MTNPNEPIHPQCQDDTDHDKSIVWYPGLTKREHFAALAMQGLIASPKQLVTCSSSGIIKAGHYATVAVQCADALITALNEPTPTPR